MHSQQKVVLLAVVFTLIIFPEAALAGWTPDGAPVCTETGDQDSHCVIADGAGGAFIIWMDYRAYTGVRAQKVDEMGRRQWDEGGVDLCPAMGGQVMIEAVEDGAGGFIVTWPWVVDFIDYDDDISAQRVDADGNLLWGTSGAEVTSADGNQGRPAICGDGAGGCIVAWQDERDSDYDDIYVQRLDPSGNALWTAGGVAVCTADSLQEFVQVHPDGSGGAILVWSDLRNGVYDLYAQRVDADGAAQWTADGVLCVDSPVNQWQAASAPDGAGGVFLSWTDNHGGSLDIYAQRVDSAGNVLFPSTGRLVSGEASSQRNPSMIADGAGGSIIAWEDLRSGSGWPDIYAQRIDASGSPLWTTTGGEPVRVHPDGTVTTGIVMAPDGAGGAIIAWYDSRDEGTTGYDIYVQRMDHSGAALWTLNGIRVCGASGDQRTGGIDTDGAGGAITAWTDRRDADNDIYAQRVLADGGYVATAVTAFEAFNAGGEVSVRWTVSEMCRASQFIVSRRKSSAMDRYDLAGKPSTRDGLEFEFTDGSPEPGAAYIYRVDISDGEGRRALFETDQIAIPRAGLGLSQNVPNPFNPSTAIRWHLDLRSRVRLEVFDAAGRKVATLADGVMEAGEHEAVWNGTGAGGSMAASGVYFYRLTAGKRRITKKMTLIR